MSDSESDPRKVVQLHSSLRTSAKASVNVGRDLSYQAARRMVREPSCAICRWAKSVTREKRLNSAPLSAIPLCNYTTELHCVLDLLKDDTISNGQQFEE